MSEALQRLEAILRDSVRVGHAAKRLFPEWREYQRNIDTSIDDLTFAVSNLVEHIAERDAQIRNHNGVHNDE